MDKTDEQNNEDFDKDITDLSQAIRLDPDYGLAKQNLEKARQAKKVKK